MYLQTGLPRQLEAGALTLTLAAARPALARRLAQGGHSWIFDKWRRASSLCGFSRSHDDLARSGPLLEGRAPSGFVHRCSPHLVDSSPASSPWGGISCFPCQSVDETKAQGNPDSCPTQTQTGGSSKFPPAAPVSQGAELPCSLLSLTPRCDAPVRILGQVTALCCLCRPRRPTWLAPPASSALLTLLDAEGRRSRFLLVPKDKTCQ